MPVRIPSDQHETVVSVLREAARVNRDLEAYVEPGGAGARQSLTFGEWDQAAEGVAGHLSRLGVAKGDVVIVPPNVVHGWADIPDHVDYLSFRPSQHVMQAGWVNPTIAKK